MRTPSRDGRRLPGKSRGVLALALATLLLAGCGGAVGPAAAPAAAPAASPVTTRGPGTAGGAVAGAAEPHAPAASSAAAPSVRAHVESLHPTHPTYVATLHVPELVWPGHGPVVAAVNGSIAAWVKARVNRFAAEVARDLANARNMPASLPPSDLTMTYKAATLNDRVLSLQMLLEPFPRGAASPAQLPAGLTFDLHTGRVYSLASLFRGGSPYLQRLATLSASGLAHFLPAGAHCYLGKGPAAQAASFGAWWLSGSNLVLSFPAGQYTAAYCGPPTVAIPASHLKDVLAPGGPLSPAVG